MIEEIDMGIFKERWFQIQLGLLVLFGGLTAYHFIYEVLL